MRAVAARRTSSSPVDAIVARTWCAPCACEHTSDTAAGRPPQQPKARGVQEQKPIQIPAATEHVLAPQAVPASTGHRLLPSWTVRPAASAQRLRRVEPTAANQWGRRLALRARLRSQLSFECASTTAISKPSALEVLPAAETIRAVPNDRHNSNHHPLDTVKCHPDLNRRPALSRHEPAGDHSQGNTPIRRR